MPDNPGRNQPGERSRRVGHASTAPVSEGRQPSPETTAPARGPIVAAFVVGIGGAAVLALILAIFTSTGGTFAISAACGISIGLLVSMNAVPKTARSSGGVAPMSRDRAVRLAIGIAIGMVLLAASATWLIARLEGGVLDPFNYLWTTFGFGLPAQAIVAVLGAAWGSSAGPIRWRS